jgi:hypothetical protein
MTKKKETLHSPQKVATEITAPDKLRELRREVIDVITPEVSVETLNTVLELFTSLLDVNQVGVQGSGTPEVDSNLKMEQIWKFLDSSRTAFDSYKASSDLCYLIKACDLLWQTVKPLIELKSGKEIFSLNLPEDAKALGEPYSEFYERASFIHELHSPELLVEQYKILRRSLPQLVIEAGTPKD